MKRGLLALALLLATAGVANAHERKAQRTVRVQVEDRQVLLLVTWTSPTGLLGQLMLARAAVLNPKNPRVGLELLMTKRALEPLHVELDGAALKPSKVERKLTFDSSSQRLMTITVLATVNMPRPGTLKVRHTARDRTKLSWMDRTSNRVQATSSTALAQWVRGAMSIRIRARRPR